MGVIYVMWSRQLKKYWRSRARMIGALGQPLLFLLALGFGFGPIFEKETDRLPSEFRWPTGKKR